MIISIYNKTGLYFQTYLHKMFNLKNEKCSWKALRANLTVLYYTDTIKIQYVSGILKWTDI